MPLGGPVYPGQWWGEYNQYPYGLGAEATRSAPPNWERIDNRMGTTRNDEARHLYQRIYNETVGTGGHYPLDETAEQAAQESFNPSPKFLIPDAPRVQPQNLPNYNPSMLPPQWQQPWATLGKGYARAREQLMDDYFRAMDFMDRLQGREKYPL